MFSTLLSVSLEKELDSSNSCKRRQSEPPLSSARSPDESYVKALSKFNEWRQRQVFQGSVRLSRKKSRKLLQRRPTPDDFSDNPNLIDCKEIQPRDIAQHDTNSYEEILVDRAQYYSRNRTSVSTGNGLDVVSIHQYSPATEISRFKVHRNTTLRQQPNELQIYENDCVLVDKFDQSPDILNISEYLISPPTKFYRENSHPFSNTRSPVNEQGSEKSSEELLYEHPLDLEALGPLRLTFEPIVEHYASTNERSNRSPPYQTVINKHGEEVEYALPLSEKLSDEERSSKRFGRPQSNTGNSPNYNNNNHSNPVQEYVQENLQLLNKTDSPGTSSTSISFDPIQFYNRENVPVTDLDKTTETKNTGKLSPCKQTDIIRELESLENWSKSISKNLTSVPVRETTSNMNPMHHFVEIIVCNTNEVVDSNPREIFETCSGIIRRGTFYNVPVTRFKPHRREPLYDDSALQLNYEMLSKIRHPNVALIMGIAVDNKCAMDSLILEPLSCSLHNYIHKEENILSLPTCLQFTLQINDAVTFLHINGLIHSNISSHSILMCHSFQIVKLASFELTTHSNGKTKNEIINSTENENSSPSSAINISYKFRPYFVNYRKIFSKHNYQAPELLSTNPFVFPKEQSDVYGICLTLWEMLNCSIPFSDLDYDLMIKLIHLQNHRIPAPQRDRQKPFEKVLENGLHMDPVQRIQNTIELKAILDGISLGTENKVDLPSENKSSSHESNLECLYNNNNNLLNPKMIESSIYDRSCTIKNDCTRNCLQNSRLREHCETSAPTYTSSPNTQGLQYGFEIGEVSIPETPIARNNKLRKNAWLSNQSISPIVHLGTTPKYNNTLRDVNAETPRSKSPNQTPTQSSSFRKVYNVNIRIRPNTTKQQCLPIEEDTMRSIEDNNSSAEPSKRKNSSQICEHINFFNSMVQSSPRNGIPSQNKSSSSTENTINFNRNVSKPLTMSEKVLTPIPISTIDQDCINEFFSRSQSSADFENSLWRREKQKCDQSVKSQRRISVKDAVDKFESFSKLNETQTPRSKKATPTITLSQSDQTISTPVVGPTSGYVDSPEKSVSRLNVVLRNKNSNKSRKAETMALQRRVSDSPDFNQTPIVTLNYKKLDRRASDLGSNLFQNNIKTRAITARHSIYGTQIFQRLAKTKTSYEDESNSFQTKDKDFKIKVGKLMCLNCGHRLFVVDDVVSSKEGDVHEGCTEMLFTPLTRSLALQQKAKSTEDFYIDDDFRDEECVNMELGARSHLSELYDIDILSAQIFHPNEERTVQNNVP